MKTYQHKKFPFVMPPDLCGATTARYKVVIVGAGPVGLTLALDLVQKGIPIVLLDDNNQVSNGSRAICFAKRSLEIFNRLGVADRMMAKGITWNTGRVFYKHEEVYHFNLQAEAGHQFPAFINLQQYYVEEYLLEALLRNPLADVRWLSKVVGLNDIENGKQLAVDTTEGIYHLDTDYLLACDGGRSSVRQFMNLGYEGFSFEEKFLIADIVVDTERPMERWFWFDPPFAPGQSVLLHQQPDNMLRIDFRLGKDVNIEEAKKPENIIPRIKAMLGYDLAFELEWVSVYNFHSRRMERFVHGNTIFLGDAAHMVSPFGARGANSGIQDADNLAWKLALVLNGKAPASLLETYNEERTQAARENQAFTESSTAFIAPSNQAALHYRDAVLELARTQPHFRQLVNSGRLSTPTHYNIPAINPTEADNFKSALSPGASCMDAPIICHGKSDWLLNKTGNEFVLLYRPALWNDELIDKLESMMQWPIPVMPLLLIDDTIDSLYPGLEIITDETGLLKNRYDLLPGTCYLIRPDQHVAGRWRNFDKASIETALIEATPLNQEKEFIHPEATTTTSLSSTLNIPNYDDYYRQLGDMHAGLSVEESAVLNAKIILLLANELADDGLLQQVLLEAGKT